MNPDDNSPGGDALTPQNGTAPSSPQPDHNAEQAAAVIRGQIDAIYGTRHRTDHSRRPEPVASTPQSEEPHSPYHRTHEPHPAPQPDQWKEYHSAWQNYYQKYYESYYTHQLSQQKPAGHQYFGSQPTDAEQTAEELSSDEALYELRQKLLGKVQTSARKVRKSRHFVPIVAALLVVLVFVFLQYNRILFANVHAYISPGSIDPQNIIIDPSGDTAVGPEPRLIIPKINVDAPVVYDTTPDNDSQMKAMEKGVAWFGIPGANSHPGQTGNTVIAGHSSGDIYVAGQYKFIFAQLEKLSEGDSIYMNYEGKRYTYTITKKEIVQPNEVNKLIYPTSKPVLTLITCTPLGTALNRLLVTAEQVSPDPAEAIAAPEESGEVSTGSIPGNAPTFLERLFGWN
jgi:sortase A